MATDGNTGSYLTFLAVATTTYLMLVNMAKGWLMRREAHQRLSPSRE